MNLLKPIIINFILKIIFVILVLQLIMACTTNNEQNSSMRADSQDHLTAKYYNSGFELATRTYNSISAASNGKIYYVLSSHEITEGGKMYSYDPSSENIEFIADLTNASGEGNLNAIPQGKSHVNFYESNGKLYFSTHIGVYERVNGMERYPENPPNGYEQYPGGHILSYDLSNGEFNVLATAPNGEGVLTMTMDIDRGHIYGITWPTGFFIHYDIENDNLKNLGRTSASGESGIIGEDFRVLNRSMFIDPQNGSVYYSTSEGDIFYYNPSSESINRLEGVNLRLDHFGQFDPTRPGTMGYNWRQIQWIPSEETAYGVHGNSGYLFRLDPREPKIEIVERITSEPSKRSGMYDQFYYGYLGFQIGPDGETLYYLTGGPINSNGQRSTDSNGEALPAGVNQTEENMHLVTFHIPTNEYQDHGPIFYEDGSRPTYFNSITIGAKGDIYTLANKERNGREVQDLVKIIISEK